MGSRIEVCARELAAKPNPTLDDLAKFIAVVKDSDEAEEGMDPYRDYAQEHLHRDGEVEIDDDAVVSHSVSGGAYVAAWVWVSDDNLGASDEEDD